MQKIRKAILPVAGFGTRFLPATKAQPKEMLPVVDKPVVQYIVEDLAASGIEEIIFVTGRGKRAIEDHFDVSYELEDTLVQKNKHDLLAAVCDISNLARFTYVRQKVPRGNGDALLQAAHLVNDVPVLVVFGDCLYDSNVPAVKQLIEAYEKYQTPIIGLTTIEKNEISKFGVIGGKKISGRDWDISGIVEKPSPESAPSNVVAPGNYVLTPEIFRILPELLPDKNGETLLTDAFEIYLKRGGKIYGRELEGDWLDTGDKFNFLKATIHMGLKHPEVGEKLRAHLKSLKL